MIKVHVLKVDMSVNDAKRLGYPKYLVSLNSTWEDSCENRWSFLNEQDIISCYPCQIVESNGRNKKEAWKIQLRGQEEPLYSLEVEYKKTLDEDYIIKYRDILPIDESINKKFKAFEVTKAKKVDIDILIKFLNFYYIDVARMEYNRYIYNKYLLTHEECNLLKEVLL